MDKAVKKCTLIRVKDGRILSAKRCTRCDEVKSLNEEFNFSKGNYQSYCKPCQSAYAKERDAKKKELQMTGREIIENRIRSGKYEEDEGSFSEDVFEVYGVQENEKAQRVYEMAWQSGHSEGFEEVLSQFDKLVELIR